MSKIKLLLDVVSDMRCLADSIQAVADVMAGNEPVETKEPTTTTKEPTPKKRRLRWKKSEQNSLRRVKPVLLPK